VIVYGRRLRRSAHKIDDRKKLPCIRVQQVLLIPLGIGLGKGAGQPVVVADQFAQRGAAAFQQTRFGRRFADERRNPAGERARPIRPRGSSLTG
jgi:hypothetical protein